MQQTQEVPHHEVVVCGAGPAGLTAAYLLSRENRPSLILEADPDYVGGLSKTVQYNGYRFDIGGHRFFSKVPEIEALWDEILPDDMLVKKRKSRIYYRRRFFDYPLEPISAAISLGPVEVFRCFASYTLARCFPKRSPDNFEDWVSNEFGSRLYRLFFKGYTEKVWGMDCREISADWASQRIRGLSLSRAITHSLRNLWPTSLRRAADREKAVKSLITEFRYPRLGPGMMWESCAEKVRAGGGHVVHGRQVVGLERSADRWWITHQGAEGDETTVTADHVISSIPLRPLVEMLPVEQSVQRAAENLRYRDFLTVGLIMRDRGRFDDHWVYIQDPAVNVGRIQNYKAWSRHMVPDSETCCYGLEYFCFEGDGLWETSDADLVNMAVHEIDSLGLADRHDFLDGYVIRQRKAYPVYDEHYASHVGTIREALQAFPGLHQIGRNGLHQYNNQDHSMMTAMLVARNILSGEDRFDPWRVNTDAVYHEDATEDSAATVSARLVPRRVRRGKYSNSIHY